MSRDAVKADRNGQGDRWGRPVGQQPNRPGGAAKPGEEANRGRAWREEEREPVVGDSRLISRQPTSGLRNNQWKDPAFSGNHEPDAAPVNGGGGRGGGRLTKDETRSQARS